MAFTMVYILAYDSVPSTHEGEQIEILVLGVGPSSKALMLKGEGPHYQNTMNTLPIGVDVRVQSVGLTETPSWVVVGRAEVTSRTLASLTVIFAGPDGTNRS